MGSYSSNIFRCTCAQVKVICYVKITPTDWMAQEFVPEYMSMSNIRRSLPATIEYKTRPHVPESLSVALTTASASVAMPTYHVTRRLERVKTGELSLTSFTWIVTSVDEGLLDTPPSAAPPITASNYHQSLLEPNRAWLLGMAPRLYFPHIE